MTKQIKRFKSGGFIAFTTLLVISSVSLAIAISISLLGISDIKSSYDLERKKLLDTISHSCLEESLLRLQKDSSYTGTTDLPVGAGLCTINVGGVLPDLTIDIESRFSGQPYYLKHYQAQVRLYGRSINLITYQEV